MARAVVAAGIVIALAAQFVHGANGSILRTVNFFSYFTVLSNLLLVVTFAALAARPALDASPRFLVLRGTAALAMIITGIVYAVLLAPAAADVDVNLAWVDLVVHTIAPVLAMVDWLVDPPPRRPWPIAATWLIFPLVWLPYTMIRGPIADWYPYPVLDPDLEGPGSIALTCLGITVVFALFAAGLWWWTGPRSPAVREPVPAQG